MFGKNKTKTKSKFFDNTSQLIDYINTLEELNKCDNLDILDMIINIDIKYVDVSNTTGVYIYKKIVNIN